MAISKDQPLRPAVQDVLDAVDTLDETVPQSIEELQTNLTQTNQQVLLLTQAVTAIESWQNLFRFGLTESVTIDSAYTISGSIAFDTPFDNDAEIAVFLVCVNDAEILTNLTCILISATYSGFSWSIWNGSESSVTVKLGFLAVRMN